RHPIQAKPQVKWLLRSSSYTGRRSSVTVPAISQRGHWTGTQIKIAPKSRGSSVTCSHLSRALLSRFRLPFLGHPAFPGGQAGADGKTGAQGPGTIAAIGMDLSGLVGPYGTVASGLDTWAGR